MPTITPRYIRHRDAPAYLGMCRDVFDAQVRPLLTEIPIGSRGVAFDRLELDAWATHHKSLNGKPPAHGGQSWQQPERAESHSKPMAPGSSTKSTRANASSFGLGKSPRTKPISGSPMKSASGKTPSIVERTLALCLRTAQRAT